MTDRDDPKPETYDELAKQLAHWKHEEVHAREQVALVRERMRALKLEDMRKQLDELKASAANRRKLADELEEQIKQIEACLLDGWKTIEHFFLQAPITEKAQ